MSEKDIPKGWEVAELDEVCQILDNLRKPINSEERIKRISGKNKENLFPYYGATGFVGYIDNYLTDGEYVLLGEDAAPFLDYSKDVAYIIKGKSWVNNHAHILLSYFDNKYLLHFLNHFNFNGYVSGTTRLKLTQATMKKIPIKLPPLAEQHRIVAKIEELFSSLDKGIESLKTAQAQLKVYRQAVLKWAFEGKLTNKNVKEGELPKGWDVKQLGNIAEIYIGSTPSRRVSEYWNGDINWISSGEVKFCNIFSTKEKISKFGLDNSSCKLQPIGSVILAMIGEGKTRGQVALLKVEAAHNQNTAAISVHKEKYLPELLYSYLLFTYEKNRGVGSGNNQKALNKERIKQFEIPVPDTLSEQAQIVAEIESRLSVCDKIEESISTSLLQAEALRQSILKKAFEGKLVAQDPNDEPASVLLAKLSALRLAGLKDDKIKKKKK